MIMIRVYRYTIGVLLLLPQLAIGQVIDAKFYGPIAVEPHPSVNSIYSASAIPLTEAGYVEEEFFMEGTANRYTTEGFATAEVIDSGHPYRTRIIVRRPGPNRFNGVVVVEWINVTGGADKDIDWWQSGHHFLREGYAYVAVSAQQMGIDTMQEWSPQRYQNLDTTHGGMVTGDALSYDIFSAVGKAIRRSAVATGGDSADILPGLEAE
ncbi:MAG: alpha/beta hydrolase domain-containing protein, partial [Gammaproteobacteria bacterium]